jgi:hypothetical protein
MGISARAESYSLTFDGSHRVQVWLEVPLETSDFILRKPEGDELCDLVIEVRHKILDGADAERPAEVWCFVCQSWFPKGTHSETGEVK